MPRKSSFCTYHHHHYYYYYYAGREGDLCIPFFFSPHLPLLLLDAFSSSEIAALFIALVVVVVLLVAALGSLNFILRVKQKGLSRLDLGLHTTRNEIKKSKCGYAELCLISVAGFPKRLEKIARVRFDPFCRINAVLHPIFTYCHQEN